MVILSTTRHDWTEEQDYQASSSQTIRGGGSDPVRPTDAQVLPHHTLCQGNLRPYCPIRAASHVGLFKSYS